MENVLSTDPRPSHRLSCDGLAVDIVPAGASVRSITMPGVAHSLVLGAADPAVYGPRNRAFLGATVGRHANRIAHGRFTLDGTEHRLSANEPPHHLHGGTTGLWSRPFTTVDKGGRHLVLAFASAEGEDGYPGRAEIEARFELLDAATLSVEYRARCNRPGPINIAPHLYFNLSGLASTRDHVLTIAADAYLPVDADLIPTGEIRAVEKSRFDFRAGRRLEDGPPVLDHCFCLAGAKTEEPRPVLTLASAASGIAMRLDTTEAGVQVYDGHGFDGTIPGADGRPIGAHGGIAIEPQGWPNAPNEPGFPACIVRPGETYRHRSLFHFRRG